jgi:hypothetical protein
MYNILCYNGKNGKGKCITPEGFTIDYSNFATNWKTIIPLDVVFDALERKMRNDILFYGGPRFGSLNRFDLGTISPLRDQDIFQENWTDIIPVRFQFHTNLLFYDSSRGLGDTRRYVSSRQIYQGFDDSKANRGQGNLPRLKRETNYSHDWTHIISGNFGGEYGGIFFYSRKTKIGKFYRMEGDGTLKFLNEYTNLSDWSHIIPLPFGFRTDLLFYNASLGMAKIYHIDNQGNCKRLAKYSDFSINWSHIIPFMVDFKGPFIIFYDGSKAVLYRVNGLGKVEFSDELTYIGQDWTHILVLPYFMPPPIYQIQIHAFLPHEELEPLPNLADYLKFGQTTLPNLISEVNTIYKEAGIQFQYDARSDFEILPSKLQNNDFLPDIPEPFLDPKSQLNVGEPATVQEQIGWRCRGRLVLNFREFGGPNYGTFCQQTVEQYKGDDISKGLAHEIGHYLNLGHTFPGDVPTSIEQQQKIDRDKGEISYVKGLYDRIIEWVESQDEAKAAIANGQPIPEHLFEAIVFEITDGDHDTVQDTPPDLGPDIYWGSTRIVQINPNMILFYHGHSGRGATMTVNDKGNFALLARINDFSRNWTHILRIKDNILLFYKAHKGEAEIHTVLPNGMLIMVKQFTNFSRNWTHIVRIKDNILLFYKAHKGEAEILKLTDDGTPILLKSFTNFSINWTHIVRIIDDILLFYKAHNREVEVRKLNYNNNTFDLITRNATDFSRNWTHIVRIRDNILLFYKAHKGEGEVLKLNKDGTFTSLKSYTDFRNDWYSIVEINDLVLFYHEITGTGVINKFNPDGTTFTMQLSLEPGFYKPDMPRNYKCNGSINVEVKFSTGQTHMYIFDTDRLNVMNYFDCIGSFHFSPQQIQRMRNALEHENRRHLVRPHEFRIKDCPI